MTTCPVCSINVPSDALECPTCHLSAALFDPVREAIGVPRSDPQYLAEVNEIVAALERAVPSMKVNDRESFQGQLAHPARFPAPPPPTSHPSPTAEGGRHRLGLPMLPPGHGPDLWRRQVTDYLRTARRRGIEISDFESRARAAGAVDDIASWEVLNRDLFVRLAATLTEEIEGLQDRRDELVRWAATPSIDTELESAEAALGMGDLLGADRRLRRLGDELGLLEDQWATIQILITETDLMKETIVELGGDPAPVSGPREEGVRLSRAGKRSEAEAILAHANTALWSVLAPLLTRDLIRLKDVVLRQQADGADVTEAALHLQEVAAHLRRRNYAAVVLAYRKLRNVVEPVAGSLGLSPGPPFVSGSVAAKGA
ncbi:MAG: hypothetical protein WCA77_09925 [Thermoplasmata archaeon]